MAFTAPPASRLLCIKELAILPCRKPCSGAVQAIVDGLGQLLTDAGYLGQFIHARLFDLLQAAQIFEQRLPPLSVPPPEYPPDCCWCGLWPVWPDGR